MFVYCGNEPICRSDSNGHFWSELLEFGKTVFSEIGNALHSMAPAYAGLAGIAVADGPLPFGDAVSLAGSTLVTLGAISYGISQATHAFAAYKSREEEKSQVQSAAITSQQSSTVIYRYGGTNPGNLTPRAKDRFSGLSFSTIPAPGAAKTTIAALNATGVVYAYQDSPIHVSVRPIGGSMDDWINAGSGSKWTKAVKSVVVKWDGVS